jgi:hypothetical protein
MQLCFEDYKTGKKTKGNQVKSANLIKLKNQRSGYGLTLIPCGLETAGYWYAFNF